MTLQPARPSPRRGRPGHDQAAVVRAAIEVFNRQGYDATSVGDVAAALGVTKSAIYHHVPSKERLLELALDEALDALTLALDDVTADRDATASERLRHAVHASVAVLLDHLPAVTLLLRVHGNTTVEQEAMARRRAIDKRLAQMVHDAVVEGEVRDDLDPMLISRLIFGMVNSLTEWAEPETESGRLAEAVTSVAFDGLRRRSRS